MIGQSFEGTDLRLLKICRDGCNDQKPAVWIDGGIYIWNDVTKTEKNKENSEIDLIFSKNSNFKLT